MEAPNYTICDFVEDVHPILSYRRPKTISHMWVFWNQEEEDEDEESPQTTVFSSGKYLYLPPCNPIPLYSHNKYTLTQIFLPFHSLKF